MTDVVILASPSRVAINVKPAGSYVIASVLRELGLKTLVVDMALKMEVTQLQAILNTHVDTRTKFVCLSTTLLGLSGEDNTSWETVERAVNCMFHDLRTRAPNAKFIVGGSRITAGDRPSPGIFDYGVVGQGETAIRAIVGHVLHGHDLAVRFSHNGVQYVSDEDYPYESYSEARGLDFVAEDCVVPGETLPLEFGRGCVFKCSYCMYHLTGKEFGDYTKPWHSIRETLLRNYERWGTTRYVLVDDTINDSMEKAEAWARATEDMPFELEFGGYMRLELLHKYPEMVQLYRKSGLRAVNFGIESFNKRAGATVGKGFGDKAKETLLALKSAWGSEVHLSANFILGLPHDTEDDLYRQAEWLENEDAVDSVAYFPLNVSRDPTRQSSDFLGYYKDAGPALWAASRDQVYFRTSLNWTSPTLTMEKAVELRRIFTKRWVEHKASVACTLSSFSFMALRHQLGHEELMLYPRSRRSELLQEVSRTRRDSYYQMLRSVPCLTGSTEVVMDKVDSRPHAAFVSKFVKIKKV